MKLTCAIVDDEYLAIKILTEYASRIGDVQVDATFTSPAEALEYLLSNTVDLLFLDIQMPQLNGFDLLKGLSPAPMVIFTTARHDYAVQAYALDVLDYLVKPIPPDRFEKAVVKAREYKIYKSMLRQVVPAQQDYLMIKADYRIHKVMFNEIEYVEGLSEYVRIHTRQKIYVPFAALKELIGQLPSGAFVRIHKSYIVSLSEIQSYTHQAVQLKNGKSLPIGRSYKAAFLAFVEGKGNV